MRLASANRSFPECFVSKESSLGGSGPRKTTVEITKRDRVGKERLYTTRECHKPYSHLRPWSCMRPLPTSVKAPIAWVVILQAFFMPFTDLGHIRWFMIFCAHASNNPELKVLV